MGPLIDQTAVDGMENTIERAKTAGATVVTGGSRLREGDYPGGFYVEPTIIRA